MNIFLKFEDIFLYFLRFFLYLKRFHPLKDCLQIGIKSAWWAYNHFFWKSVFYKFAWWYISKFIDENIIVHSLSWNQHKSKISGFFFWQNILGCFIDSIFYIFSELRRIFFDRKLILAFYEILIIFLRKFRVNWNNLFSYE